MATLGGGGGGEEDNASKIPGPLGLYPSPILKLENYLWAQHWYFSVHLLVAVSAAPCHPPRYFLHMSKPV